MKQAAVMREKFYGTLMNDFVSFWEEVSPDWKYGGVLCGFDRDGKLFLEDKSVWQQGRSLWMFSKLYNEFGRKEEWLKIARMIYDFINEHLCEQITKNIHSHTKEKLKWQKKWITKVKLWKWR